MRVAILLSFSFIVVVGVLTACNSQEAVLPQAPSPAEPTSEEPRRRSAAHHRRRVAQALGKEGRADH